MITIKTLATMSPAQWEATIKGTRNPMNSWGKSDSYKTHIVNDDTLNMADFEFFLGQADEELMTNLASAGKSHSKFRRMMPVYVDITAPLYWWKEFDTYKVGTVANSCSTMHKIHSKKLDFGDISCEKINDIIGVNVDTVDDQGNTTTIRLTSSDVMRCVLEVINCSQEWYKRFTDGDIDFEVAPHLKDVDPKDLWYNMIQMLPSSYNQTRTVFLNYEVLASMYADRKNHKLEEWHKFCDWIETLPYADLIIGKKKPAKKTKKKITTLPKKESVK